MVHMSWWIIWKRNIRESGARWLGVVGALRGGRAKQSKGNVKAEDSRGRPCVGPGILYTLSSATDPSRESCSPTEVWCLERFRC